MMNRAHLSRTRFSVAGPPSADHAFNDGVVYFGCFAGCPDIRAVVSLGGVPRMAVTIGELGGMAFHLDAITVQ